MVLSTTLRVSAEFERRVESRESRVEGQISMSANRDCRLKTVDYGLNGFAIPFHDELVGGRDAAQGRFFLDAQNQRVTQAAGALDDRATAGTTPIDGDLLRFAGGDIDFGGNFV